MFEDKSENSSDPFSPRMFEDKSEKGSDPFSEEGLLSIVASLNHVLWHTGHEQPGLSGHDDVLVVASEIS